VAWPCRPDFVHPLQPCDTDDATRGSIQDRPGLVRGQQRRRMRSRVPCGWRFKSRQLHPIFVTQVLVEVLLLGGFYRAWTHSGQIGKPNRRRLEANRGPGWSRGWGVVALWLQNRDRVLQRPQESPTHGRLRPPTLLGTLSCLLRADSPRPSRWNRPTGIGIRKVRRCLHCRS